MIVRRLVYGSLNDNFRVIFLHMDGSDITRSLAIVQIPVIINQAQLKILHSG